MHKNDRKCINETMKRDVVLGLANQLRAVEYFSKTNFFSFPIGTMTCKNQRPHCYIPPMRSRHVRIMLVSLLHFHQTPLEKQKKESSMAFHCLNPITATPFSSTRLHRSTWRRTSRSFSVSATMASPAKRVRRSVIDFFKCLSIL